MRSIIVRNDSMWLNNTSNITSVLDEVLDIQHSLTITACYSVHQLPKIKVTFARNLREVFEFATTFPEHTASDDEVISFIVNTIQGTGDIVNNNTPLLEFREKIRNNELSKDQQLEFLDNLLGDE